MSDRVASLAPRR